MKLCGIDEAGRGPVIGPMVICAAMIEASKEDILREIGAKDSKLMTPREREDVKERLGHVLMDHKYVIVPPKEIDEAVESKTTNLNWLEADKFAELIDILKPDVAVIDCSSPNIQAYTKYMEKKIKHKGVKLVVEHKADLHHPIVSAASIIAKVTRDEEIEKIKRTIGLNIGSGYPADPFTKAFLDKYWNKFDFFRKSWASWKNVAKKQNQTKLEF